MKPVTFNYKIIPAIEREKLWRKGEPGEYSKTEQILAVSMHLLRFIVIAILLFTVITS